MINFLDKGFEGAVRSVLKHNNENLENIKGIMIREGKGNLIPIPWISDSSAFNMIYPTLIFDINDSQNGEWWEDLRYFRKLETLHIYVPSEDLSFLKDMEFLKELYVHSSSTKDWTFISSLKKLTFLHLKYCLFNDLKILRQLCSFQDRLVSQSNSFDQKLFMPRLTNVSLNYCEINDISPLEYCSSIVELNLSHNEIHDLSPLKGIRSLYYLTLRYNKIVDLSPLRECEGIYYLNVRHNSIQDISPLGNLDNLSRLFLGHNKITQFEQVMNLYLVDHDLKGKR